MLTIDGSMGEGGGQLLRSSLALSMVTGTPFRIERIRANRSKPGLRQQHLTAVQAAARISHADVKGDRIGSDELTFAPGRVTPGEYVFSVGTAGSATLVFQTVLPPLLTASGPSRLTFEGGTHNPHAPPFDFLVDAYLPLINRMGPQVSARLEEHGFYPAGGGRFVAEITPAPRLQGFELLERGEWRSRRGCAIVANLPLHIAEREIRTLQGRSRWPQESFHVEVIENSAGPGNAVLITLEGEQLTEVFSAFGELGKRAEAVAREAWQDCEAYLHAGVPVDPHLADQLMLPLAIAGSGAYLTMPLTEHSTTHMEIIRRFLPIKVQAEARDDGSCLVSIQRT